MRCGHLIENCGFEWFQTALTATISTTLVSRFVGLFQFDLIVSGHPIILCIVNPIVSPDPSLQLYRRCGFSCEPHAGGQFSVLNAKLPTRLTVDRRPLDEAVRGDRSGDSQHVRVSLRPRRI